jgi:hypothetical protein
MEAADEVFFVDEVEERKRRDVARELLDTERTYVANITVLVQACWPHPDVTFSELPP